MKKRKDFDLKKTVEKVWSLIPSLRSESALTDLDLEIQRCQKDCESIEAELSAMKEASDKRSKEMKDEIIRINKKEEILFEWMKTFLYLTDDYTIENLKKAYFSERYAENHNPFVSTEAEKMGQNNSFTLYDIYSDLNLKGFDDTKLKKNPSYRDGSIFLIDNLSSRSVSSQHSEMEEDENKEFIELMKYSPEVSFSLEYQLRFFKTLLCFVIDQYQILEGYRHLKWNKDIYSEQAEKCIAFQSHFEICLRMIAAYVHGLVGFDNSESFILRELSKYRYNNEYSAVELEQIRVFGQMLSLQIRLNYAEETGELKENKEGADNGDEVKEKPELGEANLGEFEKEALALMNYNIFHTYMSDTDVPMREMVEYGKRSLQIRDPKRQWLAFNNLGVYAIDNVQRQLAYDVFYTWINNRAVGEIKNCFPDDVVSDKRIFPYKTNINTGKEKRAIVLGNLAYVCADIADTYDLDTDYYKKFHKLAETYIENAVKMDEMSGNNHRTYGTLLSERAELEDDLEKKCELYWKAVEQYELSYSTKSEGGTFGAISGMFKILKEAFVTFVFEKADISKLSGLSETSSCNFAGFYSNDFYVYLKKMITETCPDKIKDVLKTKEGKEEFPSLYMIWRLEQYRKCWKDDVCLKDGSCGDSWLNEMECLLLILNEIAADLKQNLKRRDYSTIHYFTRKENLDKDVSIERDNISPIAYYTTLNTACYLFDELQRDRSGSISSYCEGRGGRNCLTAMNARYMNDPYEGLTLLKVLRKNSSVEKDSLFSNHSAEEIREEIYKDHYIFLKSFTELDDDLAMWSRYASDYNSEGRGCNGCLIRLDTDEFGGAVYYNENRKSQDRLEKNEAEDEYYLYRVVYLTKDDEISEECNPVIAKNEKLFSRIVREYEFLKLLIRMLDTSLENIPSTLDGEKKENFLREIRDYVQQSLRLIIFLFKSDEYADEKESRIVFSRRPDQQDTIRVLPGTPAKLCINPYFQIYVKSIMFGPNVRDEENWIPYLQYQLNRMWSKNPAVGKDSGKKPQDMYKIEKSKIPYHT